MTPNFNQSNYMIHKYCITINVMPSSYVESMHMTPSMFYYILEHVEYVVCNISLLL